MKLWNGLLWGATCMVGLWLFVAFIAFSDGDVELNKVGTLRRKGVTKLTAGAAGQKGNELQESQEHSNTQKRSNKKVPKIPGQRIIPTTPEMRQMIEWLAAQMDQVPKKPPREMGDQLLQVSNKSTDTAGNKLPLWKEFHMQIRRYELYPVASDLPDKIMQHLAHEEIIHAAEKSGGSQLKILFTLKDGTQAVFKPKRLPRDKSDTLPDHVYFSDVERHFSEIACYHLDRLLGFRRAPPVVGRTVNISSDIKAHAGKQFRKHIMRSPGDNLCLVGTCKYFCTAGFMVCGDPCMLEGSMTFMIPGDKVAPIRRIKHPWRRSYDIHKKAEWYNDPEYCETVQRLWNPQQRRLWDLMDLSVLDFLSGNMNRPRYDQYDTFGGDSALLHIDQGRGFGKPFNDDLTCLQPIIHCCMLRRTTLVKLLKFYLGPVSLAAQMKAAMAHDLASPILLDKHYDALNRRVPIILNEVAKCVKKKGLLNVVQDDGF